MHSSDLERGENLLTGLGEKAPEVYSASPDPRAPKYYTDLAHLPPAGISKDWSLLGLSFPVCETRLLGPVVSEDFSLSPGESLLMISKDFLILALGKVNEI